MYNRLPSTLEIFKSHSSFIFEIPHGKQSYRITLLKDLLKDKSMALYDEILQIIKNIRHEEGKDDLTVLQLTHRVACLPGLKDKLSGLDNCKIVDLDPGAGALGVLRLGKQLPDQDSQNGVSLFNSRPWQQAKPQSARTVSQKPPGRMQATHVLYQDVAHPISDKPLFIGRDNYPDGKGIPIRTESSDVSQKHCTIQQNGDMIVLTDHSRQGTFVEGQRVDGNLVLELGQIVHLGSSGETIQLIACMNFDET